MSLKVRAGVRKAMAAALLMIAVVAGFAAPARADDPPPYGALYTDAYYFGSINAARPGTILLSESCAAGCYNYQRWHSLGAGKSPSGHSILKLQSYLNNQCVSSHASTAGGTAYSAACSTHYENWEVFPVSHNGGTFYVFKSWGAWVNQGLHLCLQANGNPAYVRMEPCDATNNRQRWG
ncbi:hypothetical protein BJ973_004970 [Actinoplanes tereljensis]|uniref:Ricin B lectin domain-containing protein n=1 Tax=Paractinoplanes tereljensis TaxID=571912 RepID=A0A919NNY4_9ACTN|nr:hypothetical protein [Actinoplanes tereljensis]GIF21585.1 hypothetical protein Ate02nite_43150 [Actinoplanes tereljensis]